VKLPSKESKQIINLNKQLLLYANKRLRVISGLKTMKDLMNVEVEKWIAAPAVQAESQSLVQLIRGSGQVGFRALHHPSGPIVVLTNWGSDEQISVRLRGEYASIKEHLAGTPVKMTHHGNFTDAELNLLSGKVCVLKASR